jgi:hypothetical protein
MYHARQEAAPRRPRAEAGLGGAAEPRAGLDGGTRDAHRRAAERVSGGHDLESPVPTRLDELYLRVTAAGRLQVAPHAGEKAGPPGGHAEVERAWARRAAPRPDPEAADRLLHLGNRRLVAGLVDRLVAGLVDHTARAGKRSCCKNYRGNRGLHGTSASGTSRCENVPTDRTMSARSLGSHSAETRRFAPRA